MPSTINSLEKVLEKFHIGNSARSRTNFIYSMKKPMAAYCLYCLVYINNFVKMYGPLKKALSTDIAHFEIVSQSIYI